MPVLKPAAALVPVVLAFGAALAFNPARGDAPAAPVPAASPAASAALQSGRIAEDASRFLAGLTAEQRKQASFAFTDAAQRERWSNFPNGIFQRAGLRYGALTAVQKAALMTLLGDVLSPYGVQMVRDQMDADDQLKANPGLGGGPGGPGGPPPGDGPPPGGGRGGPPGGGGGGDPGFGADNYLVAFLGTPSATGPWMLQFGGHHLGINASFAGPRMTLSPTLTGGQPTKYMRGGKPVYIVQTEVMQANAMLAGLDAGQRSRAVVGPQRIDLVLGPGHDGQKLQPEGLPGSAMTAQQKAQLVALIEARLGIINAAHLAPVMAAARRDIDKTYFAWFGPTGDAGSAYFRVTGPTLVLEFSPQSLGGDAANHLHNMYRDPTNEYGAAWTSLK